MRGARPWHATIRMKIAILDDYQRAAPALECFARLAAHEVVVLSEPVRDPATLAGFDALVLIRERTHITPAFLDALMGEN